MHNWCTSVALAMNCTMGWWSSWYRHVYSMPIHTEHYFFLYLIYSLFKIYLLCSYCSFLFSLSTQSFCPPLSPSDLLFFLPLQQRADLPGITPKDNLQGYQVIITLGTFPNIKAEQSYIVGGKGPQKQAEELKMSLLPLLEVFKSINLYSHKIGREPRSYPNKLPDCQLCEPSLSPS